MSTGMETYPRAKPGARNYGECCAAKERAQRRASDYQDLVTQMEGDALKNVTAAAIAVDEATCTHNRRLDDSRRRGEHGAIEQQETRSGVALHELARLFAAAVVGVTMLGLRRRRIVIVVMTMPVMRMGMPAANDRQDLRFACPDLRGDVLMMPAATDRCVEQQRTGGEGGKGSVHR